MISSAPTLEQTLFSKVDSKPEFMARIALSGALGFFAWQSFNLLSLLILFSLVVMFTRSAWATWAAAFSYYFIASNEIPQAFAAYYPDSLPVLGYLVWIISAALIALPWALSRKLVDAKVFHNLGDLRYALATIVGMVVSLLPPVSWIHWVHPGLSSGVFFPGWGLWGLLLTFILIAVFPLLVYQLKQKTFVVVLIAIGGLLTYNSMSYDVPALSSSASSVTTDKGRYKPSEGFDRIKQVEQIGQQAIDFGVPLVVFPETFLGPDRRSIHLILDPVVRDMKRNNVSLLVGLDKKVRDGVYDNALYAFGKEEGVVYRARMPMPLNGMPIGDARQRFHPFTSPVKSLGEQTVFFSICYEGYLLEHAVAAMASGERPNIMLASSNLWALKGLHLVEIQKLSILMMSRMTGVPLEWALNK